jgi:Tfp pilus assembly protein PilN
MTAVERLDRHRSAWVRILEDMARNVPEFIWLSEFKEVPPPEPAPAPEGDAVDTTQVQTPQAQLAAVRPAKITGHAFTLNALAAFMIKMMRSDYFDEVELVNSEDKLFEGEKAYLFELTANVHYLSEEELRDLIAQADGRADAGTSHKSLN